VQGGVRGVVVRRQFGRWRDSLVRRRPDAVPADLFPVGVVRRRGLRRGQRASAVRQPRQHDVRQRAHDRRQLGQHRPVHQSRRLRTE